jgi:hypothetical protein
MDHRRLHDRAGLAAGDLRLPSPLDRGGRGLAAGALHPLRRLGADQPAGQTGPGDPLDQPLPGDGGPRRAQAPGAPGRAGQRPAGCSRRSCPGFATPAPPASPSTRQPRWSSAFTELRRLIGGRSSPSCPPQSTAAAAGARSSRARSVPAPHAMAPRSATSTASRCAPAGDRATAAPTRHRQPRPHPRPRPIRQRTPTNHHQQAAGRPAQRRTR